jgi:fatty acid desaturase
LLHTAGTASLTVAGLVLSQSAIGWLPGQLLLAVAFVQWFIVLHECGHETLFRSARMNSAVGRLAAFFSLIPYRCWKRVHGSHHRWTGWQDLDPTTASLVPRPLGRLERGFINLSWRFWIPVFSILYRAGNYWNLLRLRKLYGKGKQWRQMGYSELFLLLAYVLTLYIVGPWRLLGLAGAGLVLALMIEDPLLLSQHTHIPQQVSGGRKVRAFAAFEQETFTRSLRFPAWVSRLILFNFDAHELHHMYPFVPGYHLRRIDYTGANEVDWWTWLKAVKRIRAEHFLFKNQNDSGMHI